jgi:hypothetical protein
VSPFSPSRRRGVVQKCRGARREGLTFGRHLGGEGEHCRIWRLSLRKLRAGAGFAIICAKANCFDKGEVIHFSYYDDITGLQIPLASRGIVRHS